MLPQQTQDRRWRTFAYAYTARSFYAFDAVHDEAAFRHNVAANVYMQAMFMCRQRVPLRRREVERERLKVEAAMIELGYFPIAA